MNCQRILDRRLPNQQVGFKLQSGSNFFIHFKPCILSIDSQITPFDLLLAFPLTFLLKHFLKVKEIVFELFKQILLVVQKLEAKMYENNY